MKIIEPSYKILDRRGMTAAQKIEMAGRLAYKSEDKIDANSAVHFLKKMYDNKHMPVLEFSNVHVLISVNPDVMPDDAMYALHCLTYSPVGHSPYIQISTFNDDANGRAILISGTVRAFMEALNGMPFDKKDENYSIILHVTIGLLSSNKDLFPFNSPDTPAVDPEDAIKYMATILSARNIHDLFPSCEYQHVMCAVQFIHNRAFTHELVRHRPCTYIQESQRYCRYDGDKFGNEVTFISPSVFFADNPEDMAEDLKYSIWHGQMDLAEAAYLELLTLGATPQAARTVLPNSCKTEIILYATIQEWVHIFKMRTSPAAEPSLRQLMIPLSEEFFSDKNQMLWE